MSLTRRGLAAGALALTAAPAWARPIPLRLAGRFEQGAPLIGRTLPRAELTVDGQPAGRASAAGLFVVGLDRDAPRECLITVRHPRGEAAYRASIAPGQWDIQHIDGLPPEQVAPQDEALLARIAAEGTRKTEGWASDVDTDDFQDGFDLPLVATRVSGRFGGQRVLNGQPSRPHYGADLAAPLGTEIRSPAAGLVCFAEAGLHYEGGLTMIDHGQGLVTAYLHQSSVEVTKGQRLARGQRIGAVGQEGRATGPHLCWRMKWRGRFLDPTLLVGISAPAATHG